MAEVQVSQDPAPAAFPAGIQVDNPILRVDTDLTVPGAAILPAAEDYDDLIQLLRQ